MDNQQIAENDDMKQLLKFCVNNPDLDKLESIINAFNPFKILGIDEFEIRHSNMLAWLIDPSAHHGLGDTLFKKILLEVLRDNKEISKVIRANYSDLQVMREWRNIDLLAVSPSNRTVVVIENKFRASESERQLKKYADIVEEKYNEYENKIFVFLTLDGTPPKDEIRYIPFTHSQIHDIVQSVARIQKSYMNSEVYTFIQQYLKILEEKSMQNEDISSLCAELYKEHKNAINLILEYGKPRLPIGSIREFHRRTGTESIHAVKKIVKTWYSFIPVSWSAKMPKNSVYSEKYLVYFGLNFSEYENHKLILTFNIGNFPHQDEREQFVEQMDKAIKGSGNVKLKLKKNTKVATTLLSKVIHLEADSANKYDLDDYNTITDKLVDVYKSNEVQDVLTIADSVVKTFKFIDEGK